MVHSFGDDLQSAWKAELADTDDNELRVPKPFSKKQLFRDVINGFTQAAHSGPENVPPKASPEKKSTIHWLKDDKFLPRKAKTSRVLLFGYREAHDQNKAISILNITRELASRLRHVRRACPERPILFIGHDFGITIIERTLIDCWTEGTDSLDICKATAAILFLATPGRVLKAGAELNYFIPSHDSDPRLGIDHPRPCYIETKTDFFVKQHVERFREFSKWLQDERFAMTLRCFVSDGKFATGTDPVYREMLDVIFSIRELYPVLRSASKGDELSLKTHLENGRSPNLRDSSAQSALHIAVRKEHMQVIRTLIQGFDADVSGADYEGQTPLHLAMVHCGENRELIELLFQKGADVNVKNKSHKSALELAEEHRVDLSILDTRHLFQGPSEDTIEDGIQIPEGPKSPYATRACLDFRATLAEFHIVDRKEQCIRTQPTVDEFLYNREREWGKILNAIRRTETTDKTLRCKWFHLPANNVAWVEDLFARMNIVKDPLIEDQHEGPTAWSHYMRPQAKAFKPSRCSKDKDGSWRSTAIAGRSFVIFMPFLNFERACDSNQIQKALKNASSMEMKQRMTPDPLDVVPNQSLFRAGAPNLSISTDRGRLGPFAEVQSSRPSSMGDASDAPPTPQSQTNSQTPLLGQKDHRVSKTDPENVYRLKSEKSLINGYLYDAGIAKALKSNKGFLGPLHVRRTLDQSHYFMLEDTTDRDQDQVVLRGARSSTKSLTPNAPGLEKHASPTKGIASEPLYSDKEEHPMVMVDQLWLWVIGDTVVSSFPRKWSREGDVLDKLLQYLRVDKKRAPIQDVQDLVNIIITYCVGVFNRPRTVHGLGLHDYFEEAVGSVADQEMILFRSFEDAAKADPTLPAEKLEAQRRLDSLFQINLEVKLLEETKDIRDELRMILRVLNDQALVWTDMLTVLESTEEQMESRAAQSPHGGFRRGFREAFRKFVHPDQHSPHQVITTFIDGDVEAPTRSEVVTAGDKERHPIVEANIRDFTRMLTHTNASYEALNHLLDLKQKHMSATEARFARKGAEETARQGNTIMFFTIVTIIFGSLSFVTAFFALNISAFPPGQQPATPWKLGHIVGYVAGISIGLAIPFVLIAYAINPILELSEWRERHQERRAKRKAQRQNPDL